MRITNLISHIHPQYKREMQRVAEIFLSRIKLEVDFSVSDRRTVPLLSCWQCAHLEYTSGQPGYSEYTPGYEGSLSCLRGYWDADQIDGFQLRDYILKAGDCEEFLDYRGGK